MRELRKTETTDVIMLYSGTMQGVLAFVACVTVPRSLVEPQHGWQYALLLLTGDAPCNVAAGFSCRGEKLYEGEGGGGGLG